MIVFVGAGPGAEDLITVRGQQYLKEADIIIYAGSLVNPGLLQVKKEGCEVYNSAYMTLEEVLEVMYAGEKKENESFGAYRGSVSVRSDKRADGCFGRASDSVRSMSGCQFFLRSSSSATCRIYTA